MKLLKWCLFLLIITACNNHKTDFVKAEVISTIIDSLNSKNDIEQFVRGLDYPVNKFRESKDSIYIHKILSKFELNKIKDFNRDDRFDTDSITKRIADSINVTESFYKADLDNNGFTDLIIIGDNKGCQGGALVNGEYNSCNFSTYALMNFGNDSINPISLISEGKRRISIVPKIVNNNKGIFLEIHEPGTYNWIEKQKISKNKSYLLTYEFDDLIEFNENVKSISIDKIEFSTSGCDYKPCPVFELIINKDKTASFNAIEDNSLIPEILESYSSNQIKGKFECKIIEKKFNELMSLLDYLDIPNLKNQYFEDKTHTRNCVLKITYNNGKVKKIEDFGMSGTYGLRKLYKVMFDLRLTQNWK
ncbi:DUF6438 domain-containing protein [Olleya sp. R77988]|uniref:DUF6438 domain-containing protein n=1 Tax=Olleya sp. R77988 TaxID=3093875 RepID=UPI0037CA30AA